MTRGVETDQDTGSGEVGKTPVPACRGTCGVVGGHECLFSRAETPGVGGANRQPDDIEEEVQHDDEGREVEHPFEEPSFRTISK